MSSMFTAALPEADQVERGDSKRADVVKRLALQELLPKSTSLVSTVPAVRPGAV